MALLMARRNCSIGELRQKLEVFHTGEDAIVRHEWDLEPDRRRGHPAIRLVLLWPKPCPVRTHHVRSEAYASKRFGPGQTISVRAISYSSRRSLPGPPPASLAPYPSSATVTNEMTAGRPSRTGRYRAANKLPLGVRRAAKTPVSMTTGPREPRLMRRVRQQERGDPHPP